MGHVDYDSTLIVGSFIAAGIICYIVISMEQLLFNKALKKFESLILLINSLLLASAISIVHIVGIQAYHLLGTINSNIPLIAVSFAVSALLSYIAMWLTSRFTLPLFRLILSSVVMGIGISASYYISMLGWNIDIYKKDYTAFLLLFSVLIAMSGAGLAFLLSYKLKDTEHQRLNLKIAFAIMMTLSIMGMHYTALIATNITDKFISQYQAEHDLLLFTIILVTCLVLVASFIVAMLEQRLTQQNLELRKANKELANLSIQDNLTKLPNRLYLVDYAEVLLSDHRYKDQKIAFLYIDLDRFKSVNDAFGHHIGDQLLIQMANRLHWQLNEKCKLLRIGGDEFLLIAENTNADEAVVLAEKVLQLIQESYQISGKEINISASLGVALFPEHGQNVQDLLMNADAAMLMSKEQGRNTYTIFSYSTHQQETRSQSKLINDLYKAVEEKQFILYYQPKFNTNLEVCGVEALIRWNHPALGILTPHMFIEGAEKTGLIIPMGYWALEQACLQIQEWERSNTPFYPVAVNLSALQFENKKLFSTLEALLKKYQIQPYHLIVEITESTAMRHIDLSIRACERLRDMGIRVAIDDFGTGHSSFLYLKDLPVDELKIDRGFIVDLKPGSKEEVILESIIHLAKKLGLTVTAEGVETQQQVEILTRLGCQQFQGYLLGMPVQVDQLIESQGAHFA
ncbi:diguanylate cyclase [Acinetobacter calcoaceticus]|uniref:Diguanylate cyclase n=1 Tax=Acinetobacter oleivorans TaxID=1148157 RepID=A0A0B2UH60_9GAMM|nr:EAL domain-containing protein [Acinetobacter calcoaceticus]KHN68574.1 diguanylate cyclase [Acinetobacter oleivorans]KUM13012.1 diguanylate cyclase [Acinetobacter calcoaceticus]